MRVLFLPSHRFVPTALLGFLLLGVNGCSADFPFLSPTPTFTATETPTPSATPVPLAASVNGEPILLSDFENEVLRFERAQASLGIDLATLGPYTKQVLDAMIEERVTAQAAVSAGLTIMEDQLVAAILGAHQAHGGQEGFSDWLRDNLYSEETFRTALRRQLLVQAITDAVLAQVPDKADQVHARHILVGTEERAHQVLVFLQQGQPFATLALGYSQDLSTRVNGGDLGWFAKGTLFAPEIEEAAFSLEPGQRSVPVQSKLGWHVIETLERQSNRPLSSQALESLRRNILAGWRAERMANARIEIYITTE